MPKAVKRGELLLSVRRSTGEPLRVQLERNLREAIQTGRLSPGSILPSTRVLDARRGSATSVVTRTTATAIAYSEPEVPSAPRYDLRPGRPDPALFPRRAWLSALKRAITSATPETFDYPDPRGATSSRMALASYLNRSRATVAHVDKMLLCTGFAQGMRLVCDALRTRANSFRICLKSNCMPIAARR